MGLGVTALAGACSSRSVACSIAVSPLDLGAMRLASVFALFRAWWDRTDDAFYDLFDGKRLPTAEGRAGRTRWLAEAGEAPKRLFENLFVETGRLREMQVITLVDDLAFVSVVEHSPEGIGPDCSGMPRAPVPADVQGRAPWNAATLKQRYSRCGWTGHALERGTLIRTKGRTPRPAGHRSPS